MVRGVPNISIAYTLPHNGRLSLPVDSSSLIYSQLKHVSGVPAPEGAAAVTLNKLNLLDALIGQLNQINRGGGSPAFAEGLGAENNHATYIDALIDNYQRQVALANASSATMPYIPSPSAAPGVLFNVTI